MVYMEIEILAIGLFLGSAVTVLSMNLYRQYKLKQAEELFIKFITAAEDDDTTTRH